MDGQHAWHGKRQAPDNAAETHNHKRSINERGEENLPQLRCEVPLEYVADGVKLGIVRISDEVCENTECQKLDMIRARL